MQLYIEEGGGGGGRGKEREEKEEGGGGGKEREVEKEGKREKKKKTTKKKKKKKKDRKRKRKEKKKKWARVTGGIWGLVEGGVSGEAILRRLKVFVVVFVVCVFLLLSRFKSQSLLLMQQLLTFKALEGKKGKTKTKNPKQYDARCHGKLLQLTKSSV